MIAARSACQPVPGGYRLIAELSGFTAPGRKVELLVGQTAVVPIEMAPATLQESVTVTGDAPFIDTTSSALGSNIDPRQMSELPLNGRNFVDLTLLAKGSRNNASTDELGGLGGFQLNVDGLRVTQNQTAGFGQPKYSRDAIAELEFIANRFDATMGGSSGTVVNAITKSGTNVASGTFSGYFRDDEPDRQGLRPEPGASLQQPAAGGDPRRPDHQEPGAFLRQLRVRARAADVLPLDRLSVVQLRPSAAPGWRTRAAAAATSSSPRRRA